MDLHDKIPAIYHSIFPELLDIEFPEEKIATCATCTLCRSSQSPYIKTKCCAYHPHMANYLLGGVLCDDDIDLASGKERIRAQIVARAGVTPYGIIPSIPFQNRQKIVDSQEFWTRPHELMESQRCPYYDDGRCTVWKYRENLCVTYFCSSIGGTAGNTFWKKLNKYIKMAETSLSQYAMLQLGWPVASIKTGSLTTADFKLEDEDGNVDDTIYSNLWEKWEGKEEEFYRSCYTLIKTIDSATFKSITGISRQILDAAIRDTQQNFIQNIFPDYLLLHPDIVTEKINEGFTRLHAGDVFAEIPSVLFPVIRGFTGKRKTADVFHLGYNVLFSLDNIVVELMEKGMLINMENKH